MSLASLIAEGASRRTRRQRDEVVVPVLGSGVWMGTSRSWVWRSFSGSRSVNASGVWPGKTYREVPGWTVGFGYRAQTTSAGGVMSRTWLLGVPGVGNEESVSK